MKKHIPDKYRRSNFRYYNAMREALRDDDDYGVETVTHGCCRSTIRGSVRERLEWRAFLNDLYYGRDYPRFARAETR